MREGGPNKDLRREQSCTAAIFYDECHVMDHSARQGGLARVLLVASQSRLGPGLPLRFRSWSRFQKHALSGPGFTERAREEKMRSEVQQDEPAGTIEHCQDFELNEVLDDVTTGPP